MRGTSGGLVPFSVPFIVRSGQKGASEEVVTSTVYSITSPYGLQSPSIMDLIGGSGSVSLSVSICNFTFGFKA